MSYVNRNLCGGTHVNCTCGCRCRYSLDGNYRMMMFVDDGRNRSPGRIDKTMGSAAFYTCADTGVPLDSDTVSVTVLCSTKRFASRKSGCFLP